MTLESQRVPQGLAGSQFGQNLNTIDQPTTWVGGDRAQGQASFLPEISLDPKHRLSYASWYQQVKQPSSRRKKKLRQILGDGREQSEEQPEEQPGEQRNDKWPNKVVHVSQEDRVGESVQDGVGGGGGGGSSGVGNIAEAVVYDSSQKKEKITKV